MNDAANEFHADVARRGAARRKSGAIISRFFLLFAFLSQLRDSPRIFHAANWVASGCETVLCTLYGKTAEPCDRDAYRSPFRGRCLPPEIAVKKNSTRPVAEEREREEGIARGSERKNGRSLGFHELRLDSSQRTRRALRVRSPDAYRIHSDDASFFLLLRRVTLVSRLPPFHPWAPIPPLFLTPAS